MLIGISEVKKKLKFRKTEESLGRKFLYPSNFLRIYNEKNDINLMKAIINRAVNDYESKNN